MRIIYTYAEQAYHLHFEHAYHLRSSCWHAARVALTVGTVVARAAAA